jgi:hypothetical protein
MKSDGCKIKIYVFFNAGVQVKAEVPFSDPYKRNAEIFRGAI